MHQGASKWTRFRDGASEANSGRVETIRYLNATLLILATHRFNGKTLAQHFLAILVDLTHGDANLVIREATDVFLKKVDEPTFALQQNQGVYRAVGEDFLVINRWR